MIETDVRIIHGEEGTRLVKNDKGIFVVIDILRASSTIIHGLNNGAHKYIPCLTVEGAFKKKEEYPDALLAGERHAHKIEGFQLGNSPLEHEFYEIKNKSIIFTSSNCTRMVNLLTNVPVLLIGALINCASLKKVILNYYQKLACPIFLIAVGNNGNPNNEDKIAADVIKQFLFGETLIDIEKIRKEVWKTHHAQSLSQKGYGEDVDFCTQLNTHTTVPIFMNDGFIKYNPS